VNAEGVGRALRQVGTPLKAKASVRFFKSGPGEYAEGDTFLGVTVPEQRKIAKRFRALPLPEIEKLIVSPWHEERSCGLIMLVDRFVRGDEATKGAVYNFYSSHTKYVNNWDLVDSSAECIVGLWLENKPEQMKVLRGLATSDLLWDKRIALLATFHYIKQGRADEALVICEMLLHDPHDLIQKADGWMLKEIGKRVSVDVLKQFLDTHSAAMPRTTLRYALEHFPAETRIHYMQLAKGNKIRG
jgi:3-methyladenine DNA glycosylase AlkD